MLGAPVFRTALYGPWSGNALWTAARAVPSLDLRFAESKSLTDAASGQSLVTFTRASSGTYVGSDGVLKTATTNEPRFDHNPTTGESLGLLVEEQRTNLLLRSEEFNDASWTKGNASIITNSIAAPNGTLTGTKVIEDTANSTHFARRNTSSTINTSPLTFSVYVKAAERTNVGLAIQEATTFTRQANVNFDLATGTASAVSNIGGASASSTTITAVGNQWYRCTLTTTLGGTDTNVLSWIYISNSSGFTYAGNGTSGIYIWGAQLEAGAFPTSYIPTTTATATRSADVASITGTNFSSWYRQDEGTVFADASSYMGAAAVSRGLVSIDGAVGDVHRLFRQSDLQPVAQTLVSSVAQSTFGFGATWSTSAAQRLAYAYAANNFGGSINGGAAQTDSSGTIPTTNTLNVGSLSGGSYFGGTIRRLTYWPARLANSTLQTITQ